MNANFFNVYRACKVTETTHFAMLNDVHCPMYEHLIISSDTYFSAVIFIRMVTNNSGHKFVP